MAPLQDSLEYMTGLVPRHARNGLVTPVSRPVQACNPNATEKRVLTHEPGGGCRFGDTQVAALKTLICQRTNTNRRPLDLNMKHIALTITLTASIAVSLLSLSPSQPPALAAQQVTGKQVVSFAMQFLHVRYAWIGDNPKTGFSCIGFVWYVFEHLGVSMPGNLPDAVVSFRHVKERKLMPGDIVFFQNTLWKGVSHVAIYIGHGKVIHAENPKRGVNISAIRNDPVEGSYWQQHYLVGERPLTWEKQSGQRHVKEANPSAIATVSVPELNFRSDHSLGAGIVTVLSQGTKVTVLGSWGGWLNVRIADGTSGWLVAAGVTLSGASSSAP